MAFFSCSITVSDTNKVTFTYVLDDGKGVMAKAYDIDIQQAKADCKEFRKFVDGALRKNDTYSGGEWATFKTKLKIASRELSKKLFEQELLSQLQSRAEEADVLMICTDMHFIPWEALYVGDGKEGGFLSDICIITRAVAHHDMESEFRNQSLAGSMILLDKKLCQSSVYKGPATVLQRLMARGWRTSQTVEISDDWEDPEALLMEASGTPSSLFWVCHHEEKKGLRIRDDFYFDLPAVEAYRFSQNQLIFLSTCSGTSKIDGSDTLPIAVAIHSHSGCTVVSSTSQLVLRSVPAFLNLIHKAHSKLLGSGVEKPTLIELLRSFRARARSDYSSFAKGLRFAEVMLLFVCVYGDIGVEVEL